MSAPVSPTPWELRGNATLRASDGDYIATLENNGRRTANAEFIVRACNAHDDLVTALKSHDAYMLDAGYSGPEDAALHPKAAENWRRVRSAIAKAEAQS